MRLSRRSVLSIALLTILPGPLLAVEPDCATLTLGVSICGAADWAVVERTDLGANLTHVSGITASISLRTGLSEEELMWEDWMQSHAPISARAQVLEVGFTDIDGRAATSSVYLSRHLSPSTVIVLTGHTGAGVGLRVTTKEISSTYTAAHRAAHSNLLAALKLDLPE